MSPRATQSKQPKPGRALPFPDTAPGPHSSGIFPRVPQGGLCQCSHPGLHARVKYWPCRQGVSVPQGARNNGGHSAQCPHTLNGGWATRYCSLVVGFFYSAGIQPGRQMSGLAENEAKAQCSVQGLGKLGPQQGVGGQDSGAWRGAGKGWTYVAVKAPRWRQRWHKRWAQRAGRVAWNP